MDPIAPSDVTTPTSPFSLGMATPGLVFVAGQVPLDADGEVVGVGDVAAQTRQVLANVRSVLAAAGATLADVAMANVYLAGFDGYADYNRAYAEAFGEHRPARVTVQAGLARPEFLVEISAIAVRPS